MLIFITVPSFAKDWGRICIAPFPVTSETSPIPWNINKENGFTDFYVQLDKREAIQTSTKKSLWINKIPSNKEHIITILKHNKAVESFPFTINDYTFKQKENKDLCLFVNSFYLSWQLRTVESTGSWCPCWSSE